MSATALLAELAGAGVRVTRDGDDLRVRGEPGVSVAPYREQITTNKPALVRELLQDEIVAAATAATDAFDRQHYDALWRRWYALEAEESIP